MSDIPLPSQGTHAAAATEASLDSSSHTNNKRSLQADESCQTPAKQAKGAQGKTKSQPRSSTMSRSVLPEPEKPKSPPSAFAIFCKHKWSVLVGEDKDRLEQAKLMWKVMPVNDKNDLEGKAKQLVEQHARDMEEYDAAVERYIKSLPPADRAALKQKAKDDAKQQKIDAKKQAEEDKMKAKEYRVSLKNIGDTLKGSLQICKRGGMWEVPDGSVNFSGISLGLFQFMFGCFRAKLTPQDFTSETGSIVGHLSGADAGHVFGVTKIRGGSMYATYTIRRMTVSYQPSKQQMTLAYQMDGF
mmetsp:Transcript_68115/g.121374  ORF Transcript_68115/g.121374 Transcript_68115/m.121374 type:complete len:300 (-) Transcript_68115:80-979(-)